MGTLTALAATTRWAGRIMTGGGDPRSRSYRAARGAYVSWQMALEPLRRPGHTAAWVPTEPAAVTNEWLTDVLCREVPGARVIWSSTAEASAGSSTRWRTELRYNAAGVAAGLPGTVFSKTTQRREQRMMLGLIGILPGEPRFFRDYRPLLEIEAPIGFHAAYDPSTWRSISVIEDLSETRGAEFVTALRPVSHTEIADLLSGMAAWHGRFWEAPEVVRDEALLRPVEYVRRSADTFGLDDLVHGMVERAGAAVPAELRPRTGAALALMWRGLEENSRGPATLLHGDPHIGNTYVTDAGRMGFTDWQIIQRGGWAYDVSYLLNGACGVDERRAWERELVAHYLAELERAGGPRIEPDDGWAAVRRSAGWPYFAWLMTLGHGSGQPDMQPDAISTEMVRRTATALVDHDVLP